MEAIINKKVLDKNTLKTLHVILLTVATIVGIVLATMTIYTIYSSYVEYTVIDKLDLQCKERFGKFYIYQSHLTKENIILKYSCGIISNCHDYTNECHNIFPSIGDNVYCGAFDTYCISEITEIFIFICRYIIAPVCLGVVIVIFFIMVKAHRKNK